SDKDVSGNNGMSDFWVLKLDTSGNMLWDSSFGGSDAEYKPKVHPTGGGYILAGDARSSDGDLSGNKGKEDIWVVKLDDTGSLQWEKNYGGSDGDIARSVDTTSGGGFVVAGESGSEDGDLSGNNGEYDYWVLKLDGQGNLEWEENYGGSGHDAATSIAQTPDGGYILTGRSYSSDGDVSGNNGNTDAWVVKLDTSTSSTTISKKAAKPTVRLSPNPTHDQLRIELGREVLALELTIRDLAGRTIKSQKLRDVRTLRTPIEGKPGFYFVELETAEGREVVRKVVKE
ncbi:MAG: T9SS type A sorting domain-containing protein, partial [Flavobacteriales bacterium]